MVRHRALRRGVAAKRERGLTAEEPAARPRDGSTHRSPAPAALLRPGLELAWVVARLGETTTPPIVAPGPVRKLLRFARLPDRALATLRRVVDDDAGFRARVAEVANEDDLGRPSWLWLVRPDGWEDELAALEEEAASSASSVQDERDERGARRRLGAAEEARRRADAAAAVANAAATRAGEELAAERQARRQIETEAASLAKQVAKLEGQVIALEAEAEAAMGSVGAPGGIGARSGRGAEPLAGADR